MPTPPSAASRTKQLTLVAAILGTTVVTVDSTVVNVALPAIADDLGGGLAGQQWTANAYLVTLASLILVGGSLGDLFGARRVFELGVIGFGVTSVALRGGADDRAARARARPPGRLRSAAHPGRAGGDRRDLPAARARPRDWRLDGLERHRNGARAADRRAARGQRLVALDLRDQRADRARSRSSWSGASWHSEHVRPAGARVDVVGATLCALGLAGMTYGLIEQPRSGWRSVGVWLPLAAGALLFAAFVAWEARSRHPMLPLSLFRRRNFTIGNIETFSMYAGLGLLFFFLVLFLQQVAGYSAIEAGSTTIPVTIVMFLLSMRIGALSDRYGPRFFMGGGPADRGGGAGALPSPRRRRGLPDRPAARVAGVRRRAVDGCRSAHRDGARRRRRAQRRRGVRGQQRDRALGEPDRYRRRWRPRGILGRRPRFATSSGRERAALP